MTGPDDPYFGLPLWLRRSCRGGRMLWAYNLEHLGLLEKYVKASLRERAPHSGSGSMLERLPAWIKAGNNRVEVLVAIRELRAQL